MAGRTVMIVGGAGGMGLATALRFAADGERIVLADLPGARLEEAGRQVADTGAQVRTLAVDVTSVEQCRRAVDEAAAFGDGLNVLVNAAGLWLEGPAEAVEERDWDRILDVNLKGAFFLCAAAIPHMARSGGSIINIASDAGLVGNKGAAAYCASKGGLVLLSKALALELAPRGIRVNAVCPADVETPMIAYQATTYGNGDPEGYKRRLLDHYPQGDAARFIKADEIAQFIHYLCQPGAAPITGSALSIDFGITAGY